MKTFLVSAPVVALAAIILGLVVGRQDTGHPKSPTPAKRTGSGMTPPVPSAPTPVPVSESEPREASPSSGQPSAPKAAVPFDFISALAEARSWSLKEAAIIRLPKEDVERHKEILLGLMASEAEVAAVRRTALDKLVAGTMKTPSAGWTSRSLADRFPLETHDNVRASIATELGNLAFWDRAGSAFLVPFLGRIAIEDRAAEVRQRAVGALSMLAPDQALPYVLAARTRESDPRIQNEIEIVIKVLEKRKAAQK